ncbi:DNA-methyltransferase [Planobispora siamensis]|uniref:Methyltransferase n=1 Tax=Planobispora siamensis TaxID=936338 RepID=A0A8J3SLW1_9ACTN|nr:site-specific DNA-methyltransferase [Planobispora siamensis]GIH91978.1 methyltransferase [Planobispora siamensis]
MTAFVLRGDARHLPLPDASVDLIVTSPPYWGLRDYRDGEASLTGQIGNEPTPQDYIAALLECTTEWARVLKPTGSIFVNLGDKYANRTRGAWRGSSDGHTWRADSPRYIRPKDFPEKSLLLLPERYRIGAVDELGLIARAVIVWDKPNGLPESVTDRVRRSHEDWVHLTKLPRYYSAVDEIREPASDYTRKPGNRRSTPPGQRRRAMADTVNPLGSLPGSVWEVPTEPLKVPAELGVDHFASFPTAWPRRIITGWSPPGICTACGEGRRPAVQVGENSWERRKADGDPMRYGDTGTGSATHLQRSLSDPADRAYGGFGLRAERRITGYACACPTPDAPTRPALVVDPFGGTGTTALVASALGRRGVTVDRSADYCRIAQWRTADPRERARALDVPPPPPVHESQGSLFGEVPS